MLSLFEAHARVAVEGVVYLAVEGVEYCREKKRRQGIFWKGYLRVTVDSWNVSPFAVNVAHIAYVCPASMSESFVLRLNMY